ncbi:MAG: peptide chain release factor N(5)-glutamine methyltransferase [Pseudobdellovibrio sp.]
MRLNEVLSKTIQFFKDKQYEVPRLEAELLISHALKIPRIQLYVKYDQPLTEAEVSLCREYVKRRVAGEPVAYITEEKGFYGLNFKVKSGVLIPRPETELIVDDVLKNIGKNKPNQEVQILDLGTGSGCIGLSIIKNAPLAKLVAIEKSEIAFKMAQENCALLGLEDRSIIINSPVESVDFTRFGLFDYIVANPPYIDVHDTQVEVNVRKYEPEGALFAGDQGYEHLKRWTEIALKLLKPNGLVLFEIGSTQGAAMKNYVESLGNYSDIEILKDLAGLDRIIKARIKAN